MTKTSSPKEIILEFVKQNPGCSIDDITGNNAIPKIVIHNSLASLVKSQTINMELDGDVKNFTAKEKEEEQAPKEKAAKSKPKVEDDEVPAPTSGKDFKKIAFNKIAYPKSRYILEVCRANFPKHTLTEINSFYPTTELKLSYGLHAPVNEARKVNENRQRYFAKDEDIVKTKDGKKICITNQWVPKNLEIFVRLSKAVKFILK